MVSLSQGIYEEGVAKGKTECSARSVITMMNKQGFTMDEALDFFDYDRAERPAIREKVGELLAKPVA